jgi:hypothetical protein
MNGFDFHQVLEMPMSVREIFYYAVVEANGSVIDWETGEIKEQGDPALQPMQAPQVNTQELMNSNIVKRQI